MEEMLFALKLARLYIGSMEQEMQRLRDELDALKKEKTNWAESATSARLTEKPDLRPVRQ